jgi:hypothetical protein
MITLISRWFYPSRGSVEPSRNDYVMLWLIVAAGAALRFWQLGYAGLHGDEDIMGLAAHGLLEHGVPVLPSDMVYTRALLHTYIIAGSMYLFGDTEWAMRLPSALMGSLVPLLAFAMGRRFLEPKLNLVFAAIMAFLPIMIEISQTARMYVFFIAGLLAFGALLFKWEATNKLPWLVAAFAVWLLTLHFHDLAVFAAPLFLFPGLSMQSWRRLCEGGAALGAGFVAYFVSSAIQSTYYPGQEQRLDVTAEAATTPLQLLAQGPLGWVLALAVIALILLVTAGTVNVQRRVAMLPPVGLLTFGVAACALLHYHIGGVALLLGLIFWFRANAASALRLLPAAGVLLLMTALQLVHLHGTGEFAGRQLIGALIGTPSVWPAIRFGTYSPTAIAVYLLVLGFAAVQFARRRPLPEHFLLFVIAVWAPVAAIGLFTWDAPPRYMLGVLPFMVLCLLAGISYVAQETLAGHRLLTRPASAVAVYVALVLATVNPAAVAVAASNDYRTHPDHKGAAEFIMALEPGPQDLLIAEDSINQTFYLGRVNYSLLAYDVAQAHAVAADGRQYGQYTGTPVIGTGNELRAVLDKHSVGAIYIIGSGENFDDGRRYMRRHGIYELLKSDRMEVIYEGRDNRTKVWRVRR